ncbi:hypothetical protein J7355_15675 [Endozoicomonas sp. G2_2]|uniref:hypothetical protein n=1 Tax=Endozoicomonas sp. G2_2 TaxID=2821092 RepID=UPI001ADBA126|nr:hypothetical protein [Endozoicomonas sp. G2_2]MBO9471529.1 hypothetical protein [Endozoicomonas sp. G2_2]
MRIEIHDEDSNIPRVVFLSDDGQSLFEAIVNDDQRSLTLRSLRRCTINGVEYSSTLELIPRSGNTIIAGLQRK